MPFSDLEVDKEFLGNIDNKNSNNELIQITAQCQNSLLTCLIDTGATSNYILEEQLNQLVEAKPEHQIRVKQCSQSIQMADKTCVQSLGRVTLTFLILNRELDVTLSILKDLSFNVILGMNFLKNNEVVIDADESSIYFKDSCPNQSESSSNTLTLLRDICIPAFSQTFIDVKVAKPCLETQVVNNSNSMNIQKGLYLARGCIEAEFIQVLIANSNEKPSYLKKLEVVGYLEPLSLYDVHDENVKNNTNKNQEYLQLFLNSGKRHQKHYQAPWTRKVAL